MSSAKRARRNERHAQIPLSVLMSSAFHSMPVGYQRVLWLLAAAFDGTNNGDLSLTRKQARAFGLNNERHRTLGLAELERRGFIQKTRPGGIPYGKGAPTLWALTWRSIQFENGRPLDTVRLPPMTWKKIYDTQPASRDDTQPASANGKYDTQPASRKRVFTTRTLIAPLKNLTGTPQ